MFGKSVSILVVVVSSLGTALAMGVMLLGTSRTIQGLLGIPPEVDILNLFGYQLHDASFYVCLVVITALFMLYGTAGGIVGAVRTDFIQGICIIILSGLALPFAFSAVGGMDGLRTGVAEQGKSMALIGDEFSPLMIFALLLTALFSIVSQSHIMSVTSSGKTEWEGRVGMTYGNFLKRFCTVGWCLLGVCWIVKNPTIQNPDMVFGEAIGNLLPIGFRGLMMASIMAAAMSSCDSMMIAVAGLFTENVYKKHVKPGQDEKHYVNVSRVVGIVVVVISIGFAMVTPDIYSGLKTFWKITATIGIAWWLGMFWRRANSAGAWASFLASAGILTYMNYAEGLGLPGADLIGTLNDAHKLAIFLPVGVVAGILVSLLTKPPSKLKRDRFFIKLHTHIVDDHLLPERLGEVEDEPETLAEAQVSPTKTPAPDAELAETDPEPGEPGTLEAAFPPSKWLINRCGILLPVPTRQTWGGFLVACGVMVAIVAGTWALLKV